MFGCHKCKINPEEFKDKPYEEWPCAKCSLAKDYSHTFSTGFFDTGKEEEEATDDNFYLEENEHKFIISDDFVLRDDDLRSLESIKKALSHQIYQTFAHTMVKLLYMGKTDPIMFEVLIKKMQYPHMSYSEIGATMDPKCSKQNVLYHLKRAVYEFPELESVIMTDTRYSGGHYALRTLSMKRRQDLAEQRLQQNLSTNKINIDELNKILHAPFMIRDEVFTFNAYLQDEEEMNGPTSNKG